MTQHRAVIIISPDLDTEPSRENPWYLLVAATADLHIDHTGIDTTDDEADECVVVRPGGTVWTAYGTDSDVLARITSACVSDDIWLVDLVRAVLKREAGR